MFQLSLNFSVVSYKKSLQIRCPLSAFWPSLISARPPLYKKKNLKMKLNILHLSLILVVLFIQSMPFSLQFHRSFIDVAGPYTHAFISCWHQGVNPHPPRQKSKKGPAVWFGSQLVSGESLSSHKHIPSLFHQSVRPSIHLCCSFLPT